MGRPDSPPVVEQVGGGAGRLELHRGLWLVGRSADAHLRLPSPDVSSRHAWIRRDGRASWIRDAGSTNGTRVNGRELFGDREQELHDGDRLEFGPVSLVYRDPASFRLRSAAPGVSYGDVSARTLNNAGRDINNSYTYDNRQNNRFEISTPEGVALTELATGRGAGRAVLVVGLLMLAAGFVGFAWGVLGFIVAIASEVTGPGSGFSFRPPSPLGPNVLGGIPLGVLSLAVAGVGVVLAVIGTVMSRAARERRRSR